jgi:hypothetical protein
LEKLDKEGIRFDVNHIYANGFTSVMAAPEFCGMTFEERKQFVQIVCDEAKGKMHSSVSVMQDTVEQDIEMLHHIEKVGGTHATLLLSPITARDLRNKGFNSKEQLSQWLKANTYMTLYNYWAAMPYDLESGRAGIEPFASLLKLPPEAKSPRPLILRDAPIEIVVVGGGTDAFWMAGDFFCLASASSGYVEVKHPTLAAPATAATSY